MIRTALSVLLVAGGLMLMPFASDAAFADGRVALVIGNSHYKNPGNLLVNPQNDANDVAAELRTLGFEVVLAIDADKREFDLSLQKFARLATDADAALFYYAGHAMQFQGRNYLMPIDAELEDEVSLSYQMVGFEAVDFAINRAKGVKIVILDACRNNPVANRFVRSAFPTRDFGSVRGLARIDKAAGMVVSYATAAGDVAEDGRSRNSPYTTALLRRMQDAGLEIEMMFRRVAQDVTAQTKGRQRPETVVSLLSEFYLNRLDAQAWDRIKSSDDIAAYRAFIAKYPSSALVRDAEFRVAALETAAQAREETARAERERERKAAGEQVERERLERERVERDRLERERLARDQAERDAAERRETQRKLEEAEKRIRELGSAAPNGPRPDEIIWQILRDSNDAAALDRFIAQYPASEFRLQAQARLAKLMEPKPAPPPQPSLEDVAWTFVKDTKDPAQLQSFVAQFPDSGRRAEAERRMAALAAEAAAAAAAAHANEVRPGLGLDPHDMARTMQLELKRVGCFSGSVDGELDAPTRAALRDFVKYASISLPQDDVTQESLKAIREFKGRVCPLVCPSGERADGDRCTRIVCGSGEVMKDGACVAKPAPETPKRRVTAAPESRQRPHPGPSAAPRGGGKCFAFQGRQFCE